MRWGSFRRNLSSASTSGTSEQQHELQRQHQKHQRAPKGIAAASQQQSELRRQYQQHQYQLQVDDASDGDDGVANAAASAPARHQHQQYQLQQQLRNRLRRC